MIGLTGLLPLALAAASPNPGASERGLWMGGIQLCRETVASARIAPDPHGVATLAVVLRPAARTLFERETAASVGRTMPIRLDGRVLLAPIVNEPITGGHAQIAAPAADLRAARRAARGRCGGARR